MFKKYMQIPLFTKLLAALVLGAAAGFAFGKDILVLKPLGTIFLNLLKMAALPLIVFNLIAGISSLDDPKMFGRVGLKIMIYYTLTTVVAILVGLGAGYLFQPGAGIVLQGSYDKAIQTVPSLGSTILGLIPGNIVDALAKGRFDQIVVFSAIIGVAVLFLKPEDKAKAHETFQVMSNLFNKVIGGIMVYAPIGVFSLMGCTAGTYGAQLGGFLAKYLGASYAAILIHLCLYLALLLIFAQMGPVTFLRGASNLIVTGLSTSSSLACVPVNLDCADKLGAPRSISSFTISLGSQINKDGNGMMLAITFLFAAQAVNAPLSTAMLVRAIILSLILTTGAGGVPGGGIVTIAIVIEAFGLPLEVAGIVSGIFALIDMGYTTMNCLGDLVGTIIVSRSEGKLGTDNPLES